MVCSIVFVGNVVLKVSEGIADFMLKSAASAILGALDKERDRGAAALKELGRRYQYSEHGGAPLLGIDGVSIICHGASDGTSIRNALGVAKQFKNHRINSQIVDEPGDDE